MVALTGIRRDKKFCNKQKCEHLLMNMECGYQVLHEIFDGKITTYDKIIPPGCPYRLEFLMRKKAK